MVYHSSSHAHHEGENKGDENKSAFESSEAILNYHQKASTDNEF